MKRKFRLNTFFPNYSALVCLLYALFTIIYTFLIYFLEKVSISSTTIINLAINVIFYSIVGLYFYRSKGGNKGASLYAMLCLGICTYIIPFIFSIIEDLLNLTISLSFITLLSSFGIGLIYSIILIVFSRTKKESIKIALIVLGAILLILGIISFGISLYSFIEMFNIYFNEYGISLVPILISVLSLATSFFEYILFPIIFLLFPIYLI